MLRWEVSWASGRLIWSMKKVGQRGRRKIITDREFLKLVDRKVQRKRREALQNNSHKLDLLSQNRSKGLKIF
jgi:hypothetical protein